MKDTVKEIRRLLDQLEARPTGEEPSLKETFQFYCKKQLTRFSATLDHIQPVSKGGDSSYGNLVTACLLHNSQRNAQPIMGFLARKQDAPKGGEAV